MDSLARRREGASSPGRVIILLTLDAGEIRTVELRLEEPDPVVLRGRIEGRAITAGMIWLFCRGSTVHGVIDADGRFEVTLHRPGTWSGVLYPSTEPLTDPRDLRRLELAIPDVATHELELDFDALARVESFEELGY